MNKIENRLKKMIVFLSKKGLLLVIMLSSVSIINAQVFEKDLEKVSENYKSGSYDLEVKYTFYAGHEGKVSLDEKVSYIKKKGNSFHTNQFGTEIITNNNHVLIIDHDNKILAIEAVHKKTNGQIDAKTKKEIEQMYQELYEALGIDPDKAKASKEDIKITYLGMFKGAKGYRLSYSYGEYEHLEIYINTKTNLLQEVWMYYRELMEIEKGVLKKPKVKLTYEKQTINPVFAKNEFSIDKYLKIMANGEVIIINEKYKEFQIINHLKKD